MTDYVTGRQKGGDHEWAVQAVMASIDAIVPPQTPPAPEVPPAPGQLRVSGLAFYDSNGPVLPLLCHFGEAFSLLAHGRSQELERELDRIKALGYDGIRFWDVLGYWDASRPGDARQWMAWKGREVTPISFTAFSGRVIPATEHYYQLLEAFLRLLASKGLKAQHSRGDLNAFKWEQIIAHCKRVGEIQRHVGPEVIALNESCNESWQNGVPEAWRLREMGDALGSHALRGNSSGNDDYGGETPEELERLKRDVAIIHGHRNGESKNRIGHIHAVGYETLPAAGVPGWQGEPAGPDSSVRVESHPEALALMAAMALSTHQAWVHHPSNGAFYNGPLGGPGFAEVPGVRSFLPPNIMEWPFITHGGERWREWRVFSAIDLPDRSLRADHIFEARDGRFVAFLYGNPGHWEVTVSRAFEGVIITPHTGFTFPFSGRQGERKAIDFERGRVVIGRLL